ncbi:nitroreductase family protein [Vibrio parahaemolyticus]|nr:nitroreductase family protein [Vibrio parahaemolyticus]
MRLLKSKIKNLLVKFGMIKRMPTELPHKYSSFYPFLPLEKLSDSELLSLMRHEAHRIEKSMYNEIFELKYGYYLEKAKRLDCIFDVFKSRDLFKSEPTVIWAKEIRDSFSSLEENFISPNSSESKTFEKSQLTEFSEQIKGRRSVRVWADEQLSGIEWLDVADSMIDCARWSPCSGNRQPWRFKVITEHKEKTLLEKLKEEHCTSAPLLIFIGMDRRVYGSLSNKDYETALFVDAGAAIMNMIVGANQAGLGTCWNHFGRDLIESREVNKVAYSNFSKELNIEDYIEPVAILAVGLPKYIPPTPARMTIESLKM